MADKEAEARALAEKALAEKALAEKQKSSGNTARVDIKNPTQGRRIIHDGINVEGAQGQGHVQKSITVEPGETKRGVILHRNIIDELRERNRVKKNSDLIVTAAGSATEEDNED